MGVTVLVFAVELQKVRTKCIFSDFWERTGASFKIERMWKGEESIEKSIFTEFTPHLGHNNYDKESVQMKNQSEKAQVKHPLSRFSERKSNLATRVLLTLCTFPTYWVCLRYAHSQHIESHLGKKQQQAKIPIAFLFSQLHFNNVTSNALLYGGHLVMRSNRCAVQNQGITLISFFFF